MPDCDSLRIMELFAGIGGLHWALKVAKIPCEVVAAMEINPTVIQIYTHNFPETAMVPKNLEGITAKEINDLRIDAVFMSPPCQPFCRMGNRLDTEDNRTGPLSHLTEILPQVQFKYIFVENVQGFEVSMARNNLLECLKKLGFHWQEFMLTPKVVQVPNSRLRYYLLGKRKDLRWAFDLKEDIILEEIPHWNDQESMNMPFAELKKQNELETYCKRKRWKELKLELEDVSSPCVGDYLEWNLDPQQEASLRLSESVLKKYYQAMDIVSPMSQNTCCFTKGYGHFVKGTGSILKCDSDSENNSEFPALRYFSPKEISRLMLYPEEFKLPESLSLKQKFKALGNSVNVYMVAILFTLLFKDD